MKVELTRFQLQVITAALCHYREAINDLSIESYDSLSLDTYEEEMLNRYTLMRDECTCLINSFSHL